MEEENKLKLINRSRIIYVVVGYTAAGLGTIGSGFCLGQVVQTGSTFDQEATESPPFKQRLGTLSEISQVTSRENAFNLSMRRKTTKRNIH